MLRARCGNLVSRSCRMAAGGQTKSATGILLRQQCLARASRVLDAGHQLSQQNRQLQTEAQHTPAQAKEAGTIAAVFATLSGGGAPPPLPQRFLELKKSLVRDQEHAQALVAAWNEVLVELEKATTEAASKGASLIPQVQYPGDEVASKDPMHSWMDKAAVEALRERGTVIIKGVVPQERALAWKDDIRRYIRQNPHTRGFPEDNAQVFELYWSKAQLAARGDPSFLNASRAMLSLWKTPVGGHTPVERSMSAANPLSYCDRLRIRLPGDATFALGPHIDGGGVERWEDPTFRACWSSILTPSPEHGNKIDWKSHDNWTLGENGERLGAKTDMYNTAGACSVFRPLQGWLSMSSTGPGEGTLRVLPFIKAATAYIILRPFFRAHKSLESLGHSEEQYLATQNWHFDVSDAHFEGCTLGKNIELSTTTHPHLRLDRTMVSIPQVEPGDVAFWHCDVVHAVENQHNGPPGKDSSVLYIPAIPLTAENFRYVQRQRRAFEQNVPPPDFPGGEGESRHVGRGQASDIEILAAQRAMGLAHFAIGDGVPEAEKNLIEVCNSQFPSL